MAARYDAVVIGSGPNGLSAAITIARAGRSVLVVEANKEIGGGTRTEELTLPGFWHDTCSAIHPMAAGSPFFASLPLADHGLEWIHPPIPLAHPLDDGSAVALKRSLLETASNVDQDRDAYHRLIEPLVENWKALLEDILAPLRRPRHPLQLAEFGLKALQPASMLARTHFKGERARALLAGMAAHGIIPLEMPPSSAVGLVLAAAGHAVGWPLPRGGSHFLGQALAAYLRTLGGDIQVNWRIETLDELPVSRVVLCDISPRQLLTIVGKRFPSEYRSKLQRFQYGPGAFKVDYALDGPIPWRAPECRQAGTLHLGGTLEEIALSERNTWNGVHSERPFVLVAQQSLFDATRAPVGKHTGWAYCHVPNASTVDMTARIEAQIERFAPGFRDRILARSVRGPAELERHNANLIGGDINGGAQTLSQLFTRPTWRTYATPMDGLYLCSASTPPGGGVHGMCGYFAASMALKACLGAP